MPLSIDIAINGRPIETLHIGRAKGGTRPDDVNDYLVVRSSKPVHELKWVEEGTPFTHRYGDGVEACVAKAIAALAEAGDAI